MIEINNQKEMEKYYVKETNTYIFDDDVMFKCNIDIESNIDAHDILAPNIKANNIDALDIDAQNIIANNIKANDIKASNIIARDIMSYDIKAYDIKARDIFAYDINANGIYSDNISYYAYCIARNSLKCKRIEGRFKNSIHKCLCNAIEFI